MWGDYPPHWAIRVLVAIVGVALILGGLVFVSVVFGPTTWID
jgi:hypothetical protein